MIATESVALYLVNHGKTGALGCFVAESSLALPRGTAVVIETMRGLELGTVLCPATGRPAQLLGSAPTGQVLRQLTNADADLSRRFERLGQDIFAEARRLVEERRLDLEILDADLLFDGRQAILQFLGTDEGPLESLADSLRQTFALGILFENLATPVAAEEDHHHGGCDKPDCGRAAGGSCSTCSTGGGCSSCSSGKGADMKEYFAHLRGNMEQRQRVSLM